MLCSARIRFGDENQENRTQCQQCKRLAWPIIPCVMNVSLAGWKNQLSLRPDEGSRGFSLLSSIRIRLGDESSENICWYFYSSLKTE